MTDVPSVVAYGKVVGRFVSYLVDSDPGDSTSDEVPLNGTIILKPLTTMTRWRSAVPPRLAVIQPVSAKVIDGDLCSPDGDLGVYLVATDQPEGEPDLVQWKATFHLNEVSTQPREVVFNVPANGEIDLSMAISVPPEPPVLLVVSHEDAVAAAASAEAAADSASAAQTSALAALTSADASSTSATAAAGSAAAAQSSAAAATSSATDASDSAADADSSENAAAASATAAAGSASAAQTSAENAETSRTAAATSETNAAGSASAAAASAAAAANSASSVPKWWQGTQAQYDALPVKDPTTLYIITT